MSRNDWEKGICPQGILDAEDDAASCGIGFVMVKYDAMGHVIIYERIPPQDVWIRALRTSKPPAGKVGK